MKFWVVVIEIIAAVWFIHWFDDFITKKVGLPEEEWPWRITIYYYAVNFLFGMFLFSVGNLFL